MPSSSSQLPLGWENRNNQLSEKDIKLGADASTKFANKGVYADGSAVYKTSDEVKTFYMQQIDHEAKKIDQSTAGSKSNVPIGWEDRQKNRQLEAQQYGVFSRQSQNAPVSQHQHQQGNETPQVGEIPLLSTTATSSSTTPSSSSTSPLSPEVAMVKIATSTLNQMAESLEHYPAQFPPEERAAFAAAMQRAMNALAKCR